MATPDQIQILITAQTQDAINDIQRFAKSLDNVSAKSIPNTTKNVGQMGKSLGMAGIQVQQFVGQVQNGTGVMNAMSMQAADLGFVLGFPLAGAVAGIAASFSGVFIEAITGGTSALEDFIEKAREGKVELDRITAAQKEQVIRSIKDDMRDIGEDLAEAQAALQDAIANPVPLSIGVGRGSVARQRAANEELNREIIAQKQAQVDILTQQQEDLQDQIDTINGEGREQQKAAEEAQTAFLQRVNTIRFNNIVKAAEDARKEREKANKAEQKIEEAHSGFMARVNAARYNEIVEKAKEAADKRIQEEQRVASFQAELNKARFENIVKLYEDRVKAEEEAAEAAVNAYQDVADRGLSNLEDGLVGVINGTKSAKDAFKDMAASIVNDLIRLQIQKSITGPLSDALGGALSGAFGGGAPTGKAVGGPVSAGTTYLVGERGPELFTAPAGGGTITSNSQMGGVVVNQSINISTGVQQTVRNEIATLMPQIANASKQAVLDARRRGGSFASAFGA